MSVDLSRLSLNQKTLNGWTLPQAVEGCVRAGIPWIALWRDKVEETGLEESARIVHDAGIKVSSLCRGGMFPSPTPEGRAANIEDNKRAIDEAATLGTDVLVMVCGGLSGVRAIDDARGMVRDGIEAILPYAEQRGVKLGIEPLHPAFAADRSVISLLGEANDLAEHFRSPQVGVVIDIYHVWWDPNVYTEIARASQYTLGFHVNDWLVPNTDPLMSRGMMGDGVVQNRRLREAVDTAGYTGPIEVEIFNQDIWRKDGDDVLLTMKERFVQEVM
ncbi:MAG: Sugar phosphate isomerases/epimerase [uncultured Thermomicrobiales bacterium]|uniref:Sugar phosphate isomerases/epimerase n=1 Tax=uncultured Thermomicrobiales bacterium TaxID=1645740 RepID=A0A6J4V543_9BACT|nr:MAG: Sugar phosphate isomerases/epimerase [uncultured Thermomicrobiales bacterium]